jgi:hypothetical protein
LYPNPSSGEIILNGALGQVQLQVLDLNGRQVAQKQFVLTGTQTLDLTSLGQGTYQLVLWQDGMRSVKKVVIQ